MKLVQAASVRSDGNMSFKWGDYEDVLRDRTNWLEKLDVKLQEVVVMSIKNSDEIVEVGLKDRGRGAVSNENIVVADALVTQDVGVGLWLMTGDCLPITIYDPEHATVALAHCGWKSSVARLAPKVVEYFKKAYGSNPASLQVTIGPGIHKESYIHTIPPSQRQLGWEKFLHDLPNGTTQIDLYAYNVDLLVQTGVLEKNIICSDIDTATSTNHFSHYRSVRTKEVEGRFATLVMMK